MNKKQLGFAHLGILLLVVILAAVAGGGYYVWHKNHKTTPAVSQSAPASPSPPVSKFSGTVTKIDLSAMPGDGPGYYTVNVASQGSTVVSLTSGESACNRDAILVPTNVHVGDDVSVAGKLNDGKYQVCESGTYVKLEHNNKFLEVVQADSSVKLVSAGVFAKDNDQLKILQAVQGKCIKAAPYVIVNHAIFSSPKDPIFKQSGNYAYLSSGCGVKANTVDGLGAGGVAVYLHKSKSGQWVVDTMTQNGVFCTVADGKGYPPSIIPTCVDAHGKERTPN